MSIGSGSRVQDVPVKGAVMKKEPIEHAPKLPSPSPATSDSALQASFLMHRHSLDSTS
ncbi:unnamed protein product [Staurois parvus]|uniref:Uncharacterized protein n=1 Tax=Staurois parvus TaxID=386267 RepID=A0ABN9HJQ1_9NEOB|nr:unnamed protein product [Staurois parvus]